MDFPKYNGNIHPDEWIKDLQNYLEYYRPIKDSLSESTPLKHVGTGKYLSSTENFYYTTGSKFQLIFAGSPVPDSNSLWKIKFGKELATYNNTSISNRGRCYYTSPSTNHTEVSCNSTSHISNSFYHEYWNENWKFNDSKLENRQGYLKSNDNINLSIKKSYDDNKVEFLRSHDIQFTIGNDTFQEVVCHNERLGGNDEDYKNRLPKCSQNDHRNVEIVASLACEES
ncbi:hypothetical protein RhiirB3_470287 [Rhizophagus irregularis]|nr:hypothetical protein RhiirB3_470287 [Rhizophagus irregularis]